MVKRPDTGILAAGTQAAAHCTVDAYQAQRLRSLPIHRQTGMDSAPPVLFVPVPDFRNGSLADVECGPP